MGLLFVIAGLAVLATVVVVVSRSGKAAKEPPATVPAAPHRRRIELDAGFHPEAAAPESAPPGDTGALPPELADFRLLALADLSEERRADLLDSLGRLFVPPRSLNELMSPEFLARGATKELADFLMREPVLTAKVLAQVNSPLYGLQSPIVSVQHAITFLGINAVRNIAIRFLLEEAYRTESPDFQALYRRIWDAGLVSAELCVLLSQKLGFGDTGVSSTQAVLSFVGDFAVVGLLPPDVASASWQSGLLERSRVQQDGLGINAVLAGSLLLRDWALPEGLVEGVEEIGRCLVTPAPARPDARAQRLALCYACARIGEAIVSGRIADAAQFGSETLEAPEFFHFRGYLRDPGMARFEEHLQAPDVRLAIARMIASVAR